MTPRKVACSGTAAERSAQPAAPGKHEDSEDGAQETAQAPRRAGASPPGLAATRAVAGPVILDFVKCRIEAFNREQGGGVTVSKDDSGYTLTVEDTGIPVAKLRRKGKRGDFQVLYWNRETGRWRLVSLFGGSVFSLDEALDFISNDPMECFWT